MKIILISGKARSGKDTVAKYIEQKLNNENKKVLICHYADLLKYMCKTFFNWNGEKDNKGRTILQHVGTDVIRKDYPNYWVDFIIDVLWKFYDEWDYVIIPDTRFPNEIDRMVEEFNYKDEYETIKPINTIRIKRNIADGLTREQNNHPSEVALDNYKFDYYIENDGTLNELRSKVKILLDNINKDNTIIDK